MYGYKIRCLARQLRLKLFSRIACMLYDEFSGGTVVWGLSDSDKGSGEL